MRVTAHPTRSGSPPFAVSAPVLPACLRHVPQARRQGGAPLPRPPKRAYVAQLVACATRAPCKLCAASLALRRASFRASHAPRHLSGRGPVWRSMPRPPCALMPPRLRRCGALPRLCRKCRATRRAAHPVCRCPPTSSARWLARKDRSGSCVQQAMLVRDSGFPARGERAKARLSGRQPEQAGKDPAGCD